MSRPVAFEPPPWFREYAAEAGVSANMTRVLEAIGWGTTGHWMRMQAAGTGRSPTARDGRTMSDEGKPCRLAHCAPWYLLRVHGHDAGATFS